MFKITQVAKRPLLRPRRADGRAVVGHEPLRSRIPADGACRDRGTALNVAHVGPPQSRRLRSGLASSTSLRPLSIELASPTFYPYTTSLRQNRNIFRWVEYSLSSSIMVVVIAQLNGITEITALIAIFAINASMILFGWLQEKFTTPGDGEWLPFIFGCIAGAVPWLLFVFELISPKGPSEATPPGFVYGIVASLFVLFNCFALVQFKVWRGCQNAPCAGRTARLPRSATRCGDR